MTIVSPYQKTQKTSTPKDDFWKEVSEGLPSEEEALYLVVQKFGGSQYLGFAYLRKNGDGVLQFTKEDVTHWAPPPRFPQE
jgi:hypothetical protein